MRLNDAILTPFNHIWVALSGRDGTVRINTNIDPTTVGNGDTILTTTEAGGTAVLGEYLTHPNGMSGNPSRTTVDANGDVWVGNRNEGAEKKALKLAEQANRAIPNNAIIQGTWLHLAACRAQP